MGSGLQSICESHIACLRLVPCAVTDATAEPVASSMCPEGGGTRFFQNLLAFYESTHSVITQEATAVEVSKHLCCN
jgi:hypothetical protein